MMPVEKYSLKCPYAMTPKYITVHNTANDATAENEIKYMERNDDSTSYHFAVDDKEVIQSIPTNRNAWHCGDGGTGKGNRESIGIEICYSKSGGAKFIEAEKKAAELVKKLMAEHNIPLDRVVTHQSWSGKYCPHRTLDMGWERFKAMLVTPQAKPFKIGDYSSNAKVKADVLNVRAARNGGAALVGTLKKGEVVKVGYILSIDNAPNGSVLWGGVIVNGKQGFIHLGYCDPC
jgi:N-acetylmuramoyl-L-alanine amidase